MKIISFGVMAAVLFVSNSITPPVYATEQKLNLNTKSFSVKLGATRWLLVMGDFECTEAQREWLLLRRNYCLAQISSPGASKAGYQRRDEMRGACT